MCNLLNEHPMARRATRTQEVEEEPITYCRKCYSIKVKYEDSIGMDCCGDCGCTDFSTTNFDEWENLYRNRYGHKYMEDVGEVRKNPIFQMDGEKLKALLYRNQAWREICVSMYSTFPNWLSKTDSIILLFAKLCQENRLDDLRRELIKREKNNR